MNEVQELLREAWKKAYEQGVVLNQVDFNVVQSVGGEYGLLNIDMDARMKEKQND